MEVNSLLFSVLSVVYFGFTLLFYTFYIRFVFSDKSIKNLYKK